MAALFLRGGKGGKVPEYLFTKCQRTSEEKTAGIALAKCQNRGLYTAIFELRYERDGKNSRFKALWKFRKIAASGVSFNKRR